MIRRNFICPATLIILFGLAGCSQQAVKPENSPTGAEMQTKNPAPTPQSVPGKQEPLGIVGGEGSGSSKKTGERKKPETGANLYEANKIAQARFYEEYDKAEDKLAYLLSASDSEYDAVLLGVARKLANYDDPRSIAALKKLLNRDMRIEMVRTVADEAQRSLDILEFAADKKKLLSEQSIAKQKELIHKYAASYNAVAKDYLMHDYLAKKIENNPDVYVPILIENFAYHESAVAAAKKYPELADKGLEKCLEGIDVNIVGECIGLIAGSRKIKYLDRVYQVAFESKGNIAYSDKNISKIRSYALTAYWFLGEAALFQLEKVLYGGAIDEKREAVNYLGNIKSSAAVNVLKKFRSKYVTEPNANLNLLERIDAVVFEMERTAK